MVSGEDMFHGDYEKKTETHAAKIYVGSLKSPWTLSGCHSYPAKSGYNEDYFMLNENNTSLLKDNMDNIQ